MEKIEQITILGQAFDLIKLLGDMVLVQPLDGGQPILVPVWSLDQLATEPTMTEPSNVLSMKEMEKCLRKKRKSAKKANNCKAIILSFPSPPSFLKKRLSK